MVMLKLKNGSEEFQPAVIATMMAIRSLDAAHLYELAMKCRDRDHKLFGNAGEILQARKLISPSGQIHHTIRNIVLSAIEGDGADMTIGNPIADEQTESAA